MPYRDPLVLFSVFYQVIEYHNNGKNVRQVIEHHPAHPAELQKHADDITDLPDQPQADEELVDPFRAFILITFPGLRESADRESNKEKEKQAVM